MARIVVEQANTPHDARGRVARQNRPAGGADTAQRASRLISAGHCYLFLEELRARAIDVRAPLVAAELEPNDVRLDHFISESRFLSFLQAVQASCDDANLGLHAGQRLELRAMDLLGILLRSSRDGRHAYDTYVRYGDIWRAARDADVHMAGARVTVTHVPLHSTTPRILVDMVLSRVLKVARILRASATPTTVSFSYAQPADLTFHRHLFGDAALEFGALASALLFARAGDLDAPLAHHDPAVSGVLEPHVRMAAAAASPAPDDTIALVRHQLNTQLRAQAFSLRDVAEALYRSERHLRRQLRALGTSYHDLLEDVRKQRAIAHRTAYPHDSGVRLSEELGFSEPSVFYRAFKRWTGNSWSRR